MKGFGPFRCRTEEGGRPLRPRRRGSGRGSAARAEPLPYGTIPRRAPIAGRFFGGGHRATGAGSQVAASTGCLPYAGSRTHRMPRLYVGHGQGARGRSALLCCGKKRPWSFGTSGGAHCTFFGHGEARGRGAPTGPWVVLVSGGGAGEPLQSPQTPCKRLRGRLRCPRRCPAGRR